MTEAKIEWHRLVDGDPPRTGWYMVGHRGMSKMAIYWAPNSGRQNPRWEVDIRWATHWAKMPYAPEDGDALRQKEGK